MTNNDIPTPNSPIIVIQEQQIGNEGQNNENNKVNIGEENDDVIFVKENDLKPLLMGRNNKRRAEPIKGFLKLVTIIIKNKLLIKFKKFIHL